VMQAAVVGVPHEKLGEDVFAFVVPRTGHIVNAEMLLDHGRELLAEYKVPRRYVFVEELPRNAAGKVLKRELRQRAELELKAKKVM
jgi:fatty-acyl-CoA synthase